MYLTISLKCYVSCGENTGIRKKINVDFRIWNRKKELIFLTNLKLDIYFVERIIRRLVSDWFLLDIITTKFAQNSPLVDRQIRPTSK